MMAPPKPRHRWFRFSLRTLFVVVTLVAILLAIFQHLDTGVIVIVVVAMAYWTGAVTLLLWLISLRGPPATHLSIQSAKPWALGYDRVMDADLKPRRRWFSFSLRTLFVMI